MARRKEGVRVTATVTAEQDRVLRALAAKHKGSVAWLVRYAVETPFPDRLRAALDAMKEIEDPHRVERLIDEARHWRERAAAAPP